MRIVFLLLWLIPCIKSFGQEQIKARDTLRYFKASPRLLFRQSPDSILMAMNEAIAVYPNDTVIQYNKGIILLGGERYKEALKVFEPIESYLVNNGFSCLLGCTYHVNGDTDKAYIYFEKALSYVDEKLKEMETERLCPGHECDGVKFSKVEILKLLDRSVEAQQVFRSIKTRKMPKEWVQEVKARSKNDILKRTLRYTSLNVTSFFN